MNRRQTKKRSDLAAQLLPHVVALGGTVRSRAERLGVQFALLNRYERGLCNPTVEHLETIAESLGFRVVLQRVAP